MFSPSNFVRRILAPTLAALGLAGCQACAQVLTPIPANAVRATEAHGSCNTDADCRSGLLMGCACEPYGSNFQMPAGLAPTCFTVTPCDGFTPRCDVFEHACVLIPH